VAWVHVDELWSWLLFAAVVLQPARQHHDTVALDNTDDAMLTTIKNYPVHGATTEQERATFTM
jgi:hypothetical protein